MYVCMYVYMYFLFIYLNLGFIYLLLFFLSHHHKEVREEKGFFSFVFFWVFFVLRFACQKDITRYLDPNLAQCK